MNLLGFALLGYLLGSLPFAILVSKAFGLADPRSFGSKNPGATNVLRSGNRAAAALTLLGDAAKGWFAMTLAGLLGATPLAVAFAGIAAFLGHIFPVFLGFRGGKGVATAFGALVGFSGWLGLICLGTWLGVALVFRFSSLASLAAAAVAPIAAWPLLGGDIAATIAFMSTLLFWRHRENIRRLIGGTETRIGKKHAAQ